MPRRYTGTTSLILGLIVALATSAFAEEVTAPTADTFAYPLHAGESLTDVARIFRVPVTELLARNGIQDANRLQLGQILRVPVKRHGVFDGLAEVERLEGGPARRLRVAPEVLLHGLGKRQKTRHGRVS